MHTETVINHIPDSQADSVDTDKPFVQNIFHQRFIFDAQPDLIIIFRDKNFGNFRRGHNMTGHNMPADFITVFCRSFQIDDITAFDAAEVGQS